MIYAVDFDGTLCGKKYPEIGEPNKTVIDLVKLKKAEGNTMILWTCRQGKELAEAEKWCKEQGLEFDGVNSQAEENKALYGEIKPQKLFADVYIDNNSYNPFFQQEISRVIGEINSRNKKFINNLEKERKLQLKKILKELISGAKHSVSVDTIKAVLEKSINGK